MSEPHELEVHENAVVTVRNADVLLGEPDDVLTITIPVGTRAELEAVDFPMEFGFTFVELTVSDAEGNTLGWFTHNPVNGGENRWSAVDEDEDDEA